MITLYATEIVNITKQHLPIGVEIHGAEGLRDWILKNHLDNHGWLEISRCHRAMHIMVRSGFLIKEKKGIFTKNPLTD